MKKTLVLLVFLSWLFIFIVQNASAQCNGTSQLGITTQFRAIDRTDLSAISKYQYPYYNEDDSIRIENIFVENEGSCSSENSTIKYLLNTPDNRSIDAFCTYYIKIPSLKQNETYYITYVNTTFLKFNNIGSYRDYYMDSQNKTLELCRTQLDVTGIWKVSSELDPLQTWGWSIKSGRWLYNGEFKVRDQLEILSMEQQERNIAISYWAIGITAIMGFVSIFIQIWLARQEDKRRENEDRLKQKQILRSLEAPINEVEVALNGHKELLNKNIVPSYFIPSIDYQYYVSQLNSYVEFGVKNKKMKPTYALKQSLIKLENKIKNINRIIELAQNTVMIKKKSSIILLLKELMQNTYYHDAEVLLGSVRYQWKNLGGFT
jgi:hypothetical protein